MIVSTQDKWKMFMKLCFNIETPYEWHYRIGFLMYHFTEWFSTLLFFSKLVRIWIIKFFNKYKTIDYIFYFLVYLFFFIIFERVRNFAHFVIFRFSFWIYESSSVLVFRFCLIYCVNVSLVVHIIKYMYV